VLVIVAAAAAAAAVETGSEAAAVQKAQACEQPSVRDFSLQLLLAASQVPHKEAVRRQLLLSCCCVLLLCPGLSAEACSCSAKLWKRGYLKRHTSVVIVQERAGGEGAKNHVK
jgi:hypothetical protein